MQKLWIGMSAACLISASAEAQPANNVQPDYASARELTIAVQCTLLKYVIDARGAGFQAKSADGKVTFKTVKQIKRGNGLSVTLPLGFIEIAAESNKDITTTYSETRTVDVSIDPNQEKLPDGCKNITIQTLNDNGKPAGRRPVSLFSLKATPTVSRGANKIPEAVTIAGDFSQAFQNGPSLKIKVFGGIEAKKAPKSNFSSSSNYEVVINFAGGRKTAWGIMLPKPKKEQ